MDVSWLMVVKVAVLARTPGGLYTEANGVQYSNSLAQRAVVEGRYVSTMGNPAFGGYSFISISGGRDGSMQTNEVQVKGSSSAVVKIGVSRHINAGEVFQFVDDTPSGSGYLTNCDVIY